LRRIRVIPVLLLKGDGLVKSVKFANHKYVGDPINAVKIFNEKEVDEISLIDINATKEGRGPNIRKVAEIASEAFMPMSYGGGITTVDQVQELLYNGIEKVILNKAAVKNPSLITAIADRFGAQSVVVSLDIKKNIWGKYKIYTDNGSNSVGIDPIEFAQQCEKAGAGEILLQSIERDGTYNGYDIPFLQKIAQSVSIPVIIGGGAGSVDDFRQAVIEGHASAVCAGSMFVFQRPHNAVLISYPSQKDLKEKLYSHIS
jgi:imidazole glycerol-phosphate synthase subunit HisF